MRDTSSELSSFKADFVNYSTILLFVSTAYVVAESFTNWVVAPLQSELIGISAINTVVLFLPHGIRVLAAWILGWRSFLYLLPVIFYNIYIVLDSREQIYAYLFSMLSAPAAVVAVSWAGMRSPQDFKQRQQWRVILIVAVLSSFANAIVVHTILRYMVAPQEMLFSIAAQVTGDILGTLFVMLILVFLFRVCARCRYFFA